MSNVIQFLETLGSNPALSAADYVAAVAGLDVGAAQQQALLERDQATLGEIFGGRMQMYCMIMTPDETDIETAA